MKNIVSDALMSLSVTGKYRGYTYAITACELIAEDERILCSVMDKVYPKVAEIIGCNEFCVERNIRTIIFRAWDKRCDRLKEIAGYPLSAPPSVSEFLAILTHYAKKEMKKHK